MKILFLTNKLPYPPMDGGSIATLNMITGLNRDGHQVSCLSLNTLKHSFPIEKIPRSLSAEIRFMAVPCDTSINAVRMLLNLFFSRIPYIAERFNNPSFRERLIQVLSQNQFDIIQIEGPYMGHYLEVVRQKSKAAVSFRAHNLEHIIWKRKATNEKWPFRKWYFLNMSKRLKRFEAQVVEQTNCLIPISPLDEKAFREMGFEKPILTIPTGLNLKEYRQTELPPEPSVFFIGALDWLPNQEGLLWFLDQVSDQLREEIPGLQIHVAGRNAPKSFENLISKKEIIYHGEVENAKEFMSSYRVMIAPLFTGSGIRIKILEAMALGRPVVTTPIGIEGISARNNREVMISDNPEAFKKQIVKLIRNDILSQELAAAGRRLIRENFDTFGLSSRITRFFKEQV